MLLMLDKCQGAIDLDSDIYYNYKLAYIYLHTHRIDLCDIRETKIDTRRMTNDAFMFYSI